MSKAAAATTQIASTALRKAKDALPFVSAQHDKDEYRWAELQRIEKTRRSILLWVEEPFWKILTHYNGTVVRFLVRDLLLYITMALYVAVRLLARYTGGVPTFLDELGQGQITVVGGFIRCVVFRVFVCIVQVYGATNNPCFSTLTIVFVFATISVSFWCSTSINRTSATSVCTRTA